MKVSLFYASDGVVPQAKMLLIIDREITLPPGRYDFVNVVVNNVNVTRQKMDLSESSEVKQWKKTDTTSSVTIYKVKNPPPEYEEQEPLEDIRPDDTLAPYEAMYRMMEKLYNGRTDQDLSASRDKNFDEVFDSEDEDKEMVVSRFGLLKEEYLDEETGEIVETASGGTKVHLSTPPEPSSEPPIEPPSEPPAEPSAG